MTVHSPTVTTFYILGAKTQPEGLVRHVRSPGPGNLTYAMYDPRVDAFVASATAGGWILSGDTMLTAIHESDVEDVKRRIRLRATNAAAPTVDPDDPFANGLSAVRFEGVFGHRPGE